MDEYLILEDIHCRKHSSNEYKLDSMITAKLHRTNGLQLKFFVQSHIEIPGLVNCKRYFSHQ